MADQKALRDLMRKEKERRAGGAASALSSRRPGKQPGPRGAEAAAPSSLAGRAPERAVQAGSPEASGTTERGSAAAVLSQPKANEGSSTEEESGHETAAAAKRAKAEADTLAMPPPAVPKKARLGAGPAAGGGGSPTAQGESPKDDDPLPASIEEDGDATTEPVGLATVPGSPTRMAGDEDVSSPEPAAPSMAVDAEQPAEPEPGVASELPAGFFDDPNADARARGLEAPAVRAERELEEGLKKFEREMAVERERAEETRHELDEKRYEEIAAEEADLQSELQRRLAALRRKAMERSARQEGNCKVEDGGNEPLEEEADDSGSDVEFDWRCKGFG